MDPDATLASIRDYANDVFNAVEYQWPLADLSEAAEKLAQAIDDLDAWLLKGGMLPADWWKHQQ